MTLPNRPNPTITPQRDWPGRDVAKSNQTGAKLIFGFMFLVIFVMIGKVVSMAPLVVIGVPLVIGASYVTGAIIFRLFPSIFGDLL